MKKVIKIAFPVVFILMFIFIMNASFIFHPFIKSVPDKLDSVESSVLNGDWSLADKLADALMKDIRRDKFPWMQFSIEREEINLLLINLYELKGSIKIKDTGNAINSLYEIRANWSNLGS